MNYPFDCISEFIFVEPNIAKSDIILIPGASQHQLMEKAAELYHQGLAQYILPSGGENSNLIDYKTEWEFLKTIGANLGVPENIILKEDKAKNTFENAQFSWDLIKDKNIEVKNVILVCKYYHSRRALLSYKSVFPSYINFYISPVVDKREISKANWFLDENKINIVMNEVAKIGMYFKDKIPNWI